jgi:hypothetical protein
VFAASAVLPERIGMQRVKLKPPQLSRTEFRRRADRFLEKIQQELMPDHAKEIVAINVDTGEYVLGHSFVEATDAYDARWPHDLSFVCRIDGGPALRLKSAASDTKANPLFYEGV